MNFKAVSGQIELALLSREPEVAELLMESRMTEIEVATLSAKRKGSEERFNLVMMPFELSPDQCQYRNPSHNIDVRFEARFVRDNARGELWSAVVLIDGQMQQRVEEAAGQRLSKTEIESSVSDCYDLIAEYLRVNYSRFAVIELQPRIYAAPTRAFHLFSLSAEVDQNAIAASRAVQIR